MTSYEIRSGSRVKLSLYKMGNPVRFALYEWKEKTKKLIFSLILEKTTEFDTIVPDPIIT
jgi:hypothetical protein